MAARRIEQIGDCTLYLGDCLEIMPTLGKVDAVITDPPYEDAMQKNWGVLSSDRSLASVQHEKLGFDAIDEIRTDVTRGVVSICDGWAIIFCMAEGVRAWRDEIELAGGRYKRAMVWVKPNPTPQFNGQGPGIGHEMMVSAWCGRGHSRWNGGGRAGNFYTQKPTNGNKHPTQKPIDLIEQIVSLFSNYQQTILDPFMGSGTTGVACVKLGRKFIGIEIDEGYFNIACERIRKAYAQPDLFIEQAKEPKPEQISLLEAGE